MRLSLSSTLVAAALCAVSIVSCGPPEPKDGEHKTVFRYNESGGITSLDPAMAGGLENIWAVNQLFNGLVQVDSKLKVQPCIAKSWEQTSDGKIFTFHLREDVYFHDNECFESGKGRNVVASDFVYSFNRLLDEKTASTSGTPNFDFVDFGEASGYEGFVAEDDRTLKIFLKQPHPAFLRTLTMQFCSVVPEEAIDYYRLDFGRNPVGTGPFVFNSWAEDAKLILTRNPNYFETENGKQLPYLDAVAISFVRDRNVEFLEFKKGNFDFISSIHPSFKDQVLTHTGEIQPDFAEQCNVIKQPYLKTDYLGILVDESLEQVAASPLRIKAIRQALNYGFDREKMVLYLRNNIGTPATSGFVPAGMPSFDPERVKGYDYNPEKARELLAEAGFPKGEGMPEITLSTTKPYQALCEFLVHDLGEVGFNIKFTVVGEAAFRNMVDNGKMELFRKSWVADYPEAENFLSLFYSRNHAPEGVNRFRFTNAAFDALYEQSLQAANDSLRQELYWQMDSIVMAEAPVVPLFYDQIVRLVQKDVEGLETNAMNLLTLKRVRKTQPKE